MVAPSKLSQVLSLNSQLFAAPTLTPISRLPSRITLPSAVSSPQNDAAAPVPVWPPPPGGCSHHGRIGSYCEVRWPDHLSPPSLPSPPQKKLTFATALQAYTHSQSSLSPHARPAARYAQTRSFVASSVRRDSEAQPKESLASASEMHDKLPVPYGPNQLPPFLPNPRNGNYFTVDNPNRVLECIRPLAPNHRYKGKSL